jgi:hypothetical protein
LTICPHCGSNMLASTQADFAQSAHGCFMVLSIIISVLIIIILIGMVF